MAWVHPLFSVLIRRPELVVDHLSGYAALVQQEAPREELKQIVQEAGQLEVPKLERYLGALLAIAYIAPLIGLLGTVLGLIDTFIPVTANGFAASSDPAA